MYGMIHKAARDMAIARLGEAGWSRIAADLDIDGRHFITAQYFDDAICLDIVDAIAAALGLDRDAALDAFGRHWMVHADASSHARLLAMLGDDLATFLDNLDRLHAGIKASLPRARMPSFRLLDAGPEGLTVLYQSEREGLGPFARGLLRAAADRFGVAVAIEERAAPGGVLFRLRPAADAARCA
jgi:hypothetical protein